MTRAQLFWLAYLWVLDQHREEECRRLTLLLDEAYAKIGKLWARALLGSPMMRGLKAASSCPSTEPEPGGWG